MSDQARPAEIEDVLSSIRRLVAGEAQSDRGSSGAPAQRVDAAPASEPRSGDQALVLTPSLLVRDAQDEPDAHRAWDEDAAADSETAAEENAPEDLAPDAPVDAQSAPEGTEPEPTVEDVVDGVLADQTDDDQPDAPGNLAGQEDAADAVSESPDPSAPDPATQSPVAEEESEPRKSPFLSETLIAQRAAKSSQSTAAPDDQRSGFGFAGARRDDPVRHVPLSDLGPARKTKASEADEPSPSGQGEERTLHLSVATDAEEEPLPSSQDKTGTRSAALISPGFATEGAPTIMDGEARQTDGYKTADAPLPSLEDPDAGSLSDADPGASEPEAAASHSDEDEALQPSVDVEPPSDLPDGADVALREELDADDDAAETSSAEPEVQDAGDDVAVAATAGPVLSEQDVDFLPDCEDVDAEAPGPETLEPGEVPEPLDNSGMSTEGPPWLQPTDDSHSDARDATTINVFGKTAPALDEEALRAMIADVVQQELQGSLGERVSDNIRLLVRREVARALEDLMKDTPN